jgi:hypothetical protein
MAMVIKYISDLLHYHDCVIVPGLGGFVANHKSAIIMEGQNLFMPPVKDIGFNRSLSHHDGLLIDFIARHEGTTYQAAMLSVESFVVDVKEGIHAGKTIDLGDIGTLCGDAIGNLQFSPKEGNSFLPESFGLISFRFEPLDYKHIVKFERDMEVPRLLLSRSPKYWTAVAAMVAGFFFLATTELKMPDISQAGFMPVAGLSIPAVTEAVSVQDESSIGYDAVDMEHTATEIVEAPVLQPTQLKYHLIGASFPQSATANNALKGFISEGFTNAHVVDDGKGRHRIALQSFEHRSEAVRAMEEYRKQPRYSTVWVFTLK